MKTVLSLLLAATTVAAYAQPGSLDKSFGKQGVFLDTSIWALCYAMAIQPDGKILAGGLSEDTEHPLIPSLYIARYNTNGSIDQSFGENGKTLIRTVANIKAISARKIVVQPDNKILALCRFVPGALYGDVGLIRLNEDGSVDSSFGTNGFVLTTLSPWEDVLGGWHYSPMEKLLYPATGRMMNLNPGRSLYCAICRMERLMKASERMARYLLISPQILPPEMFYYNRMVKLLPVVSMVRLLRNFNWYVIMPTVL